MCPDLLRHAEQFVDITLAITDVKAAPRSIQKLRGLLQIIKPPDALLLLNGNARRIDLFLQRSGPLELLPGPEFDRRQPKRQPRGCHRKARMHQDPADGMRSQTTRLVASTVYALRNADRLRALPLVSKLGRIMEHKHEAASSGCAITGRLKMTGQNVRLADAIVREKAISCLGVSPILADQRNALPHGTPKLRKQLPEPVTKSRVPKFAPGNFPINPAFSAVDRPRSCPSRSIPQY